MQSPEVAQEDQDDGLVGPVVAEAVPLAVGAGQREVGQRRQVHREAG
jgi:hypothetical protein